MSFQTWHDELPQSWPWANSVARKVYGDPYLEGFKDGQKSQEGTARYLIWSEEHGAWWKPYAAGYTRFMTEAGRYSKSQTDDILEAANKVVNPETGFLPERKFNEIAIPDPTP